MLALCWLSDISNMPVGTYLRNIKCLVTVLNYKCYINKLIHPSIYLCNTDRSFTIEAGAVNIILTILTRQTSKPFSGNQINYAHTHTHTQNATLNVDKTGTLPVIVSDKNLASAYQRDAC